MKVLTQNVKSLPLTCEITNNINNCAIVTRLSRQVDSSTKTDEDNLKLVQSLISMHHYEPLEFCNLYIDLNKSTDNSCFNRCVRYIVGTRCANNSDAHARLFLNDTILVCTLREFAEYWENHFPDKQLSLSDDIIPCMKAVGLQENHFIGMVINNQIDARYTFLTISNRQIQTEISRHRSLSKNWESTRWCRYDNPKFDRNLRICIEEIIDFIPGATDEYNKEYDIDDIDTSTKPWLAVLVNAYKAQETIYLDLNQLTKDNDLPSYTSAFALPSALKAEVAYCGFGEEIDIVGKKRTTDYCGNPHVYAKALVNMILEAKSNIVESLTVRITEDDEKTKLLNRIKELEEILKKYNNETRESAPKRIFPHNDSDECRGCAMAGKKDRNCIDCALHGYYKYKTLLDYIHPFLF